MRRAAAGWYLSAVPDMTPEERDAEIERLERKAKASKGMPGYSARLAEIYKRIEELKNG